jgi:predicted dehydrogenase
MQKLRFGILSTANIAIKVSKAMHDSTNAAPLAIGSRDLAKSQRFAKENNIPRAYGSYEEVLKDPDVDAVYIPLPTAFKTEWAIKAARAGKHILVDKPLGSAQEVHEMRKACDENGVHFMDNTMWVHHDRTHLIYKEYISQPDFNLRRVNNVLAFNADNPSDIRFNPELEPYGALGDVGWYSIRNILWSFNYELPISVIATMNLDEKTGAIMDIQGILQFSKQRTAMFSNSMREAGRQWTEIVASDKTIRVNDFVVPYENEPYIFQRNDAYNAKTNFIVSNVKGDTTETVVVAECHQVVATIQQFARDCQDVKNAKYWGEQTLKTMIVMDSIYESAKARGETIYLQGVSSNNQNLLMVGQ